MSVWKTVSQSLRMILGLQNCFRNYGYCFIGVVVVVVVVLEANGTSWPVSFMSIVGFVFQQFKLMVQ